MKFNPVLSSSQLKRLGDHKYSCTSSSLLEPFLQPWWNWVVSQLPFWLAPNLITITGLAVNIITSLVLIYLNPDGKQETPRWAALLCAVGIFIYQTLDAIDGKQARRTGTSSPLGELFDHGCDSLSTVFVALAACITVGLGVEPWWMFLQCFFGFTLFYCAHWQTYVSGTLRFGKIDVTEAQYGIMFLHILTFLFGGSLWEHHLSGFPVKYVVVVTIWVAQSYTLYTEYISTILKGGSGKNGSTIAGTSVLGPAIPLALVVVPAYVIACKSEEQVFEQNPSLYILAFGLVVAKVTNRLVVAHMTRSEMSYLDSVLIGPSLLAMNQYFNNFFQEYYVLWLCLAWALFDLYRYCRVVCWEICQALGIELFRIVPKLPSVDVPSNGNRNGRHRKS